MRSATAVAGTVVAAVCALAFASGATAKTYDVTRKGDPNPGACKPTDCSLREAVLAANAHNGPDTVVLPSRKGAYRLGIPNELNAAEDGGMTGDLDVSNHPLAIVHLGKGKATVTGTPGFADRLIENFAGAPLKLSKLKLTRGSGEADGSADGGGIHAAARLLVKRSALVRNSSDDVGGAIDMDETAPLRIVRSKLAHNEAGNTAGAVRSGSGGPITIIKSQLVGNRAEFDGGAMRLSSAGPVRIVKTTISGNRTGSEGGGIQNDGEQPLTITDSTISGNFAAENGGGIQIGSDPFETRIVNSTIAGNRTLGFGGGIYTTGDAVVTVNALTIVRNTAAAEDEGKPAAIGGGIYHEGDGPLSIRNSIIALNTVGALGSRNDCGFASVPPGSLGHNLLSTDGPAGTCEGFNAPGDLVRSNPKLGKLKRNGGPTKTVALKPGSAAVGHAHKPSAPNRDQRGRKRDNDPDTGAFERGA